MSEQYKQDADTQSPEIEEDPLAELARIVAGEPELNPQPEAEVVEEVVEQTPVQESPVVDASMEAALEEQLMNEFSSDDTFQDEMAKESVSEVEAPSFVEDINSTIEQISTAEIANEEATYEQEPAESQAEVEVSESIQPQEANPEVGFQDGLIDALEMEIGGKPAPEPVLETAALDQAFEAPLEEPLEEIVEAAETAPFQDPVAEVEMQASNVQSSLEQELSDHYESYETPSEEPGVYSAEERSDFPTETSAFEEVATEEPVQEIDEPVASIEQDLGAAFDSEFEQLAAQQPEPAPVFQVEETAAETVAAAAVEEPVQGDPTLEMDFEAAFAEELEVAGVPESQGWAENETEDANAAFTAAASSPSATPVQTDFEAGLDQMEHDPGHVGSVEDIASVDAGAVAANDNGGGMKFAIAALVLALFAGAIAAGYGFLGGDDNTTVAAGTPEIIKADADPVKIKPEDPGGVVPENQDNASYVDIGGENSAQVSQETLTSQTEEPLVLNTGPSDEVEVADTPKSDDRLTSSEDAGATPNATNSAVLPKVVQTVVVKPDGTILAKPAAPKPVTPEAVTPEPAAPKPVETALNTVNIGEAATVEPKPVSTQVIKKPEAIDGAKSTNDIAVPIASPLPKPKPVKKVAAAPKPKKAAPAPTRKSEWVVQVSSQRTPEAAQSSFSNMRNKYSVLRGRAMSIQRANVNGTTYYRVRVQTASRDDANQLCTSLATAGGSCFVTR